MSVVFLILAFCFNSGANILLKLAAGRGFQWHGLGFFEILSRNVFIIAALVSFGLNLIFYFLALERIALSIAYPIMNVMSIVIIFGFAIWYFHDSITLWQAIGYALMVTGMVMVFYFSPKS